jgi:glycogen synthase
VRILTVGNMYPPHHLGGYEVIVKSAVDHLRAKGHEVAVLTTDFALPEPNGAEEPRVFRQLRWYWHDHEFPRLSLAERLRLERHNGEVFDRRLRELAPEVILWGPMGGMSTSLIERANRRGLPAACLVCDNWLLYAFKVDAWMRAVSRTPVRPLRGLIERRTGVPTEVDLSRPHWMFISEYVRKLALNGGLRPHSTEIAHAGVDPAIFRPAPARDWDWRLLYVGRLDDRKGIHLLVEALPLLPDAASLAIVGGGDDAYLRRLRLQVSELGLEGRVSFSTSPHDSLGEVYAGGDVLVFPVLWDEPWGLVPLEAMAVGTPVLATGRGGSAEYLRHEDNCLLFDPDEGAEAVAAAVRRLAGDPGLRARLREGGLATAPRFTEEACNERIAAALASLARR